MVGEIKEKVEMRLNSRYFIIVKWHNAKNKEPMSITTEDIQELKKLATSTQVTVDRLRKRVHFYYNIIVLDSDEQQLKCDFFRDFRELHHLLPKLQQLVDRIDFNRCYAHEKHLQYTNQAECLIDDCRKKLLEIYNKSRT